MEMSRFLYEVGFCCCCARAIRYACPDVNANHQIERNYGNSVRFLAKIPNGPRPNRRATVYFGTQLISVGCILLKKNLNANRPAFCRQFPLFTRNVPLKTFSRLAGLPTTVIGGGPRHRFQLPMNRNMLVNRWF